MTVTTSGSKAWQFRLSNRRRSPERGKDWSADAADIFARCGRQLRSVSFLEYQAGVRFDMPSGPRIAPLAIPNRITNEHYIYPMGDNGDARADPTTWRVFALRHWL
jgi:hypothetical protein